VREITFETGDLGQSGQDLILDAVGEEGIVRVGAEILERQHGDGLAGDR
jgi:hypothetical protein